MTSRSLGACLLLAVGCLYHSGTDSFSPSFFRSISRSSLPAGAKLSQDMSPPAAAPTGSSPLGNSIRELRAELAGVLKDGQAQQDESVLFNSGTLLLQQDAYADALVKFESAVAINPKRAASWFQIALIRQSQGNVEGALHAYERALEMAKPEEDLTISVAASNNLIGLLVQENRLEAAGQAADRAVNRWPDDPRAWTNLGVILVRNQNLDWAEVCFENALLRGAGGDDAQLATALNNMGAMLARRGQFAQAISMYERCVAADATDLDSLKALAGALADCGDRQQAALRLRQALALDPSDTQLQFQLAALEGSGNGGGKGRSGGAGSSVPREYVSNLFDYYAERGYDDHMLTTLQYKGPELLWESFIRAGPAQRPLQELSSIELGVGSGLCGSYFRAQGLGSDLLGCDLSPVMVQTASRLEDGRELVYSSVVVADCVEFLEGHSGAAKDLVLAADVLCYMGDLDALFRSVRSALGTGGRFLFTTEELAAEEGASATPSASFDLQSSGRFSHSVAYIQGLARRYGFEVASAQKEVVRVDGDVPIPSIVFCLLASSAN